MVATAEVAPTTQNTGLARINASERIMSLCQNGESAMKFITDMGKTLAESRMLKLKNPQQGAAVVFASICEETTPFQLMKEFHIMDDGGMSMKSDVMLAKFNAAGGKHLWVNTGDDGEQAILRLMWNGQDIQVAYHIDDAKRAGLVRPKSNWEKDPGSMLRARATSKGVRMVMPGIVAGIYCPEDLDGGDIPPAEPPKRTTTKKTSSVAADDPNVEDATFEPAAANGSAPFDGNANATTSAETGDSANDITTVLAEIELLLPELGKTKADIEEGMRKNNPKFTTIDDLPLVGAQTLLGKLRAAVEKKRASAAA